LAKWKQSKEGPAPEAPKPPPKEAPVWMPWEDPGALATAQPPLGPPPGSLRPAREQPAVPEPPLADDGEDPLDAFMAAEVMPEVKAKEEEMRKAAEKEKLEKAKLLAEGKKIPRLADLEDSDEEEVADVEIQVPENKVKLVIGPGGTKINEIQRKSKCRVQLKKTEEELNRGFGTGSAAAETNNPNEKKMVTFMLFGSSKETELASTLIEEAIENKEQKQKQRQKEYDRKREQKRINREMYHLRHALDYEALGVPVGSSKADVKKAYRKLAVLWHPDKHASKSEEEREKAGKKFQEIQNAYDRLMSTDEDAVIEQLKAK